MTDVVRSTLGTIVVASLVAFVSASCRGEQDARGDRVSVTRVTIDGCGLADEIATGVAAIDQPDLVLTVAHALSGSGEVTVDGRAASVLALDPRSDLALLGVGPDESSRTLRSALANPEPGLGVSVLLIRDDVATETASIIDRVAVIRHTNKVDDTVTERSGLVLDVELVGGDSGAPVVGEGGGLLGIMYADAKDSPTSYAISSNEIRRLLDEFDAGRSTNERPVC